MEDNPSPSCACAVLPGVIDRWELLQAQALSKELRTKQNPQRWQQFHSDLNRVLTWLRETEEDLERLQHLQCSTDIQPIALQIKKLKVATLGLSRSARQKAATRHARSDDTASPGRCAVTQQRGSGQHKRTRTLPQPPQIRVFIGRVESWTALQNQPQENNHDLMNW